MTAYSQYLPSACVVLGHASSSWGPNADRGELLRSRGHFLGHVSSAGCRHTDGRSRHRGKRTRGGGIGMNQAAFLDEATQLFNSTLDLLTVLQQVVQRATQVLGDSCTIFLLEEGTD